ncbi:hypothetical protein [Polynucleobacter brandtiae]|uniref:Uncharacterized protein n=1 Tax=Polynucleobacter brandtiae TaxID=1938816 RepID=A0A2M8VS12_9BURK|nr:hypothetical protein [Polynucleobacter brandtiae]PJI80243.1 hypothetical protein B0G85_1240 [Polynucleobacter brandtiae]
MKTNSEIANRKKIVSGAIGSLRIEGLKPSEIIIQETKERYRKA